MKGSRTHGADAVPNFCSLKSQKHGGGVADLGDSRHEREPAFCAALEKGKEGQRL